MNRKYLHIVLHMNNLRATVLAAVLLVSAAVLAQGETPKGVRIGGNVYGGGNLADVGGSVTVNMSAGTVEKDVYGGGALANTNTGNWESNALTADGYHEVTGLTVGESYVFGLYEGDAHTPITSTTAKAEDGKTYYRYGTTYFTSVNLTGGTINGDAYGGGLGCIGTAVAGEHYTQEEIDNALEGDAAYGKTTDDWKVEPVAAADGAGSVKALVYGDVSVTLGNSTSATAFNVSYYDGDHSEVVKSGRVFGCNNLNGHPLGNVTVTVNKTVAGNKTRTASDKKLLKEGDEGYVPHTYEVATVYGGGNLANNTASGKKTNVVIATCDVSIKDVYGGGNAAAVPETDVLVNGAYEIKEVFGGGNGKDPYTLDDGTSWTINPGADVNGNATTLLKGGYILEAYGGSNSKGTISGNVSIDKSSGGACDLTVIDLYGAGKDADIEGDLIMVMGCSETRTENLYGCAKNANVKGNVELTITSGEYGRVFGGNNVSGSIFGHIIVNIEEVGCSPIIIDELYACGNDAAYSVYGYYQDGMTESGKPNYVARKSLNDGTAVTFEGKPHTVPPYADPEVNIISCTRIGKVFGGGLGSNATVYGNPKVNINMIKGVKAGTIYNGEQIPDQLGAVGGGYTNANSEAIEGGVFGGGNEARVEGNPTVNIGTEENVYVIKAITTGESVSGYYTYNEASYVAATGTAVAGTTYYQKTTENGNDVYTPAIVADGESVSGYYTFNEASYTTAAGTAVAGTTYYEQKTVLGANVAGNVYGGGNLADVGDTELGTDTDGNTIDVINMAANTFVNICALKGNEILDGTTHTGKYNYTAVNLETSAGNDYVGVTISGSVFGGGRGEAAGDHTTTTKLDGAFRCGKAMVTGNTNVAIGNGTVSGSVYGGGMVGRVEGNTTVSIGFGTGFDPISSSSSINSAPVISHDVFGAGKGVNTHGYSALVRGEATVTVAGNAKIQQSIYGGGEIASTGRYKVAQTPEEAAAHDVEQGMPYVLDDSQYPRSGYATVTVKGYAEVGRDDMQMKKAGGPDDTGYVFGAGKGILPYEDTNGHPGRIFLTDVWESYEGLANEAKYLKYIETLSLTTQTYVTIDEHAFIKGSVYGGSENGHVQKDTYVYVKGHCQIGNGWDDNKDNGEGNAPGGGVNHRYADADFINPATATAEQIIAKAAILNECAHWDFGKTQQKKDNNGDPVTDENGDPVMETVFLPYDKYTSASGGATTASDGHTFFGNVFGGGSGLYPYIKEKANTGDPDEYAWLRTAGRVYGNTNVEITGGHILTSVYGGCELTDVGNGLSVESNKGRCFVKMSGGTLGVPRTLAQIAAHPVTCYLFGAGKGDQRTSFNQWTNVGKVRVEINDSVSQPIIYGSIFGGGEDGHVLGNADIHIKKVNGSDPVIGTWGTSYVEGNVFGAGRGFGGEALTAGVICGNVNLKIEGGQMLGSIYGGGRLGSVGTYLAPPSDTGENGHYGVLIPDGKQQVINSAAGTVTDETASDLTHGYITINISGGTIGNKWEYQNVPVTTTPAQLADWKSANYIPNTDISLYKEVVKTTNNTSTTTYLYRLSHTKGGNVFAGSMGRMMQLDGSTPISDVDWWKLGSAKTTTLNISGTAVIKSNVYGGGELGMVQGGTHTSGNNNPVSTEIIINGGTIGTEIQETIPGENEGDPSTTLTRYTFGSVFGGGYGSLTERLDHTGSTNPTYSTYKYTYPKYIAGRVKGSTEVTMTGGKVLASIYGGGEMAAVGESKVLATSTDPKILGETLTGSNGVPIEANTYVTISGGEIGKTKDTEHDISYGGAKMGNVYGGGSGHNNTVRSGHIYGNTNVTINAGSVSGEPKIYHNVYGGGAYGTVGDFEYDTKDEEVTVNNQTVTTKKVSGVKELKTSDTGVATVTITGGTIGYDGKENGMVFGSSRGDINEPGQRDDYTAWTYKTYVTIGTSGSQTGPQINGTVYGSGENGHVFNDAEVNIHSGTIGIYKSSDVGYTVTSGVKTYSGAAYPYRGNVYGGGCGTDKYYSNHALETHDGEGDSFNALAGVVYGNAKITITGGQVVRNVYGAGAMGSVGKTVSTTTEGVTTKTTTGGVTTINISGGQIGVDGTAGDGCVFGAARGDAAAIINEAALVRKETNVSVTGGEVKGNVYGGGELGCVGVFEIPNMSTFTWKDTDGTTNTAANTGNKNTGICNVTVDSIAIINGHVFGAGKGKGDSFWCEKGIAYKAVVHVSNGTVNGNVYGGGEVGRVETDTEVNVGIVPEEEEDETSEPTIHGSVFGGGAGLETHGYSALVRGNTTVTVDQKAHVAHSVYGGGEIASVGKYGLDTSNMPSILKGGGYCYVTVKGNATIAEDVFGAGQGVTPHFDNDNADHSKRSRRMTVYNSTDFPDGKKYPVEGYTWEYYEDYPDGYSGTKFVWDYLQTPESYSTYLETLALVTHPEVTIEGSAAISGSVFGGGELGLTKGSVVVNIEGGTITEDVYGGGSLANTNIATKADLDGDGVEEDVTPTTTVNLKSGTINRNVYGGGLGRLAKDAVTAVEAKVYGTVLVELNKPETTTTTTGEGESATTTTTTTYGDCVVKGTIFGCNNLNGSPQKNATVHVYKTVGYGDGHQKKYKEVVVNGTTETVPDKDNSSFDLTAVYGGGNLAAFYPDDATARATAKACVIIDGCDLTSIGSVYGGGNAASTPATEVTVNGTYEIGSVFGGGNGKDDVSYDGGTTYLPNPGANVGYKNYSEHYQEGDVWKVKDMEAYDTKEERESSTGPDGIVYGTGKTQVSIYGGTVHAVYGGSNTKGNVRIASVALLDGETIAEGEEGYCVFNVDEAYGGGKNADMDGTATLIMSCIQGMKQVYGGAEDADVLDNVVLNITNGTFDQVFGGNNKGGRVAGSITVNIEETGCKPVIIGELYGGGNMAAYSKYGYYQDNGEWKHRTKAMFDAMTAEQKAEERLPYADPQVNVKSFTGIGNIFGGGYGAGAVMVADPTLNINVVKGRYSDRTSEERFTSKDYVLGADPNNPGKKRYSKSINGTPVYIPYHGVDSIGAIYNVYGGGNAANVIGSPHVNIGTKVGEVITLVSKPIEDGEGKTSTQEGWIPSYQMVTVEGVDIRGNVFGGGNNAAVTGNTDVVVGKNNDVKTYVFKSFDAETGGNAWSSGLAQTTGETKSNLAEVVILSNGKYIDFVGKKYYVNPNATQDGSTRTQLMDENGTATGLWVAITKQKTYSFKSYSAASGGTQYSTGTAAPTGNFKVINGADHMQIQVLTNPGETSWVGKTFYVPATAKTDESLRYQLRESNGELVSVWVTITE